MLILLIVGIGHAAIGPATPSNAANGADNLTGIAKLIFTTYVFPFEVTSALLITAALGAMVLAHRERASPGRPSGSWPPAGWPAATLAPEPPPGVYALHDAVDLPALLPDGTTTEVRSVRALSPRDLADDTHGSFRPNARDHRGKRRMGAHPVREGRRMSPVHYVSLSVILFVIGAVGVLVRRNAIVVFMCIELMLNACNLAFVAFAGCTAIWTARSWRSS